MGQSRHCSKDSAVTWIYSNTVLVPNYPSTAQQRAFNTAMIDAQLERFRMRYMRTRRSGRGLHITTTYIQPVQPVLNGFAPRRQQALAL